MSHYSQNRDFVNSYSVPRQGRDQHIDGSNQFARSASARLFRNNKDQDEPLEQGAKKVQQREESMKRLLEWKQRMLQAPLSRSTTGVIDAGSATAINPSSNVNRTMSPAPMISDSNGGLNSTKQRQSSYNSYSSDDEASLTNKLGVYPKASTLPMRAVSPRLRLSQETLLQTDKYTQKLNGNEYSTTKTDYDKYYSRNLYDSDLINSDPNSGKFMYKEDQDRYGSKQGLIRDYDAEYGSREMFVDAEYGSRDNLLGTNHGEYDSNYLSRTGEDWSRLRRSGSQVDDLNFIDRDQINRHLNVSAGDLLGRTHEELVLLLIQLRRQNAATARAVEQCCSKIHQYQSRLGKSIDDSKQREENLQKLNALKHHLLELEKQYEKGKPLVNLVDNMVKLGALYKGNAKPTNQRHNGGYLNDKLEFNQRLEERRLMKEEQKYWDSANVDEQQLQNKMRQLQEYSDQLREQSNTLQGLRKDEESLRGALASLKTRMQQGQQLKQTHSTMNSAAGRAELLEKAREQERALERELTKVRELLVNNSKKLENTLSANSRAEDELRVMTHRFQESKTNNGSQQQLLFMGNMNSNTNGTSNNQTDSVPYAGGATALLESELRRVQEVVGDIQRQRQELSLAVRELTDRSQYVDRDVLPKQTLTSNASIKKRPQATWLETDLDLMITLEHGINIESDEQTKNNLYKNMINNTTSNNGCNLNVESRNVEDDEDSGSENKALGALNANSQERSEVKTVRIVKRESERRHRDRNEKTQSWNYTSNLDHVMEEETNRPKSVFENDLTSISSSNQQRPYSYAQQYSRNAINNSNYPSNASTSFLGVSNNIYTSNNYSSDNLSSRDLLNENNLILSKYNSADHFSSSQNLYGKSEFPSSQNLYGSRDLKNLSKCESIVSLSKSAELSPVFHSQAAKDIISTININDVKTEDKYNSKSEVMIHKRQVPKEKRRHYTAPTNDINMKGVANMDGSYSNGGTTDLSYSKEQYDYRACDDLDMERALRTKSADDSTTIISSGSNSNAPDLVRSTIQDSELLLSNTSYSKNHNGDYMYGSSYVNNADQKITYRNTNISDSIERKYNYLTPNSNKDDNYMDMTYSSKNTKSALKQDDNFSSKNLFYNKFDYGSENYVSKTRSSALDDTPISSSRKPEFIETSKDYLHTRTFSDKNVCDDDSYTYHSKDSKLAADGKYFSNEKKIDDNLCSDSVADKETSSDVPVKKDSRFSDNTIDKLLAAPSKILIPERYIPEKAPELTPEELERRQQKAESIRKMLSTTSITPTANNTTNQEGQVTTNEKRQREHLLQLNQILAKEVMEMSKIVAGSNTNSTLQ
ncbi:uncharacterized protein LOC113378132 isoform X3 [Ctenocephalides felis]|uniref:uncharacterized protein LOC113378132 isoform X3 n=1 Tax=Ctenocephalides felis TaxID=7515 RepID=UPI000E6E297B|nr:uncharacterized protein LOC113378132 isoform X3 [Ctenocephalides felis]